MKLTRQLNRRLNRRRLLRLSLLGGIVVGAWALCRRLFWPASARSLERSLARPPERPPEYQTLAAYVDTLIPEDETPSATQVGVVEKILAKSAAERPYKRLIQKGCAWLDTQAGQYDAAYFAALSEAQREAIVRLAADGQADLLPLRFFRQTQQDAFFYYYAHPRSWPGLGYPGPSQPQGFLDYTYAPRKPQYD